MVGAAQGKHQGPGAPCSLPSVQKAQKVEAERCLSGCCG